MFVPQRHGTMAHSLTRSRLAHPLTQRICGLARLINLKRVGSGRGSGGAGNGGAASPLIRTQPCAV